MMKQLAAAALVAAATLGTGASVLAGEVNGNGDSLKNEDGHLNGRSECAYSGLEDEPDLVGSPVPGTPDGALEHRRYTQTPGQVWISEAEAAFLGIPGGAQWIRPHGMPRFGCNPNAGG